VEQILAGIWQELLGVERVGRRDNFFELGGHSLHGIKLMSRIEQRVMSNLSVVAIFRHPTIEQMAEALESSKSEARTSQESQTMTDQGVI
jgi:hypothetical protein